MTIKKYKKHLPLLLLLPNMAFADHHGMMKDDTLMKKMDKSMNHKKAVVISEANIDWGLLNPLRGDQSPKAADLFGDRTQDLPTGMLVKFEKGFFSPPHIHNITYRGVVIKGMMHNDDPNAAMMWMPSGSFWTQPAGESHITAAAGSENLIYLEIDSGPYKVLGTEKAYDNGERPINIEERNVVWADSEDTEWVDYNGAEISYLWGDLDAQYGVFLKLPKGFKGELEQGNKELNAVVVSGSFTYHLNNHNEKTEMTPSSFFRAHNKSKHKIETHEEVIIYVSSKGKIEIDD